MIYAPHVPVMLNEVSEYLLNCKDGIYLDGTIGFGGHSLKILEYINNNGQLIGLDLDPYALEYSNKHLSVHLNLFSLHHANYQDFPEVIETMGIKKLNGMLFDLGTSSYQVDSMHRGFSYMKEAPLDMRYNYNNNFTAEDFLNSIDERNLATIIYQNSGEKKAKKIAYSILRKVDKGEMKTTFDLRKSIERVAGGRYLIKSLSRVFQSIRIYVNDELSSLKNLLKIAFDYLEKDGRIIFITFHSIEDQIVKSFFKQNILTCICHKDIPVCQCNIKPKIKIITKKAIIPSHIEISSNNRSRSAKMRVAERI